jgi:alpha-amylase
MRGTILQPWNWFTPEFDQGGQNLWQRLARNAYKIKNEGYTAIWLPPSSLAVSGTKDVGYGIKDWYNFTGTKYGTLNQLIDACKELNKFGINIYHDQVFNHLMGGNIEKNIWCKSVEKTNMNQPVNNNCVWFQCDISTDFPWLGFNHNHFDAYLPNNTECFVLSDKKFLCEAYQEAWGGSDLDYDNIEMVMKLKEFGLWFKKMVLTDGYRFDAVKHIRPKGTLNFLTEMRKSEGKNMFAVGEFLHDDVSLLHDYISKTYGQISLYDVPLQRKMVRASQQGNYYDMGSIFNKTLVKDQPGLAVTYVHSHDDMPPIDGNSSRGEYIGDWFISQAYAIVLLRDLGYPCVSDADTLRHADMIKRYLLLRQDCTYGERFDRIDHNNTIGWSFPGDIGFDNSMAVVITNGGYGKKWLPTRRANTRYLDFTESLRHTITTDADGWAEFECPERNSSVWIEESKFNYLKDKLFYLTR